MNGPPDPLNAAPSVFQSNPGSGESTPEISPRNPSKKTTTLVQDNLAMLTQVSAALSSSNLVVTSSEANTEGPDALTLENITRIAHNTLPTGSNTPNIYNSRPPSTVAAANTNSVVTSSESNTEELGALTLENIATLAAQAPTTSSNRLPPSTAAETDTGANDRVFLDPAVTRDLLRSV